MDVLIQVLLILAKILKILLTNGSEITRNSSIELLTGCLDKIIYNHMVNCNS